MEFEGKLKGYGDKQLTFEISEKFNVEEIRRKTLNGTATITFHDKDNITTEQRKIIFALIGDICDHTGFLNDEMDIKMRYYFMAATGHDSFSLAANKVTKIFASEYIEFIIEWCLDNDIPFLYREYHIAADIHRILFIYLKHRACFVCGKHHADIAHYEAVGIGRNRKTIDQSQHRFMALCREHHTEQHTIGLHTFMKKHILVPIKLSPEQIKEFGI